MSNLRITLRRLLRAPGFAVAVVAILTLGIGGLIAIYTLVEGVLLRPLPYPEADRLVRLTHEIRDGGRAAAGASTVDLSDAALLAYQEHAAAFEGIAAWRPDDGNLSDGTRAEGTIRVHGARVTANFFEVLGVPPKLGRGFGDGEDRPRRNGVVVLSYELWQDRFDRDPEAIGRELFVNDVARTIIGVMPATFAYPSDEVRLWLPLSIDPANPRSETFNLIGVGRLEPGVSLADARDDLTTALGSLPTSTVSLIPRVEPLHASMVGPVSSLLLLLFAGMGLVLVVVCANVAGLFALRAERARPELALRTALGCGTSGILARSVSEVVVLSLLGGAGGIALSFALVALLRNYGAVFALPRLDEVAVRGSALLLAVAATVLSALAVAVLPAIRARSITVTRDLHDLGSTATARSRTRDGLVVAQIALAFVLLSLFGLTGRSFLRLHAVDPGFEPTGVATSRILLPYARYGPKEDRVAFFAELVERLRAAPGVTAVGVTDWVPLDGHHDDHRRTALDVDGRRADPDAEGATHAVAAVDGAYFRALGIPLLRGRAFGAVDPSNPATEVLVSRAFADRYWPGESPLGRRVRPVGGRWHTVVGEVADVHYDALESPPDDLVYFPLVTAGTDGPTMPSALSVVARTELGTGETLSTIRAVAHAIDPAVPTYDEASLVDLVRDASERSRVIAVAFALAAALTTLLGAIGLYGVIAYGVGLRRRELAVRMALGARPEELGVRTSVGGLRLGLLGIALGLPITLGIAPRLDDLLFGVGATDPVTLAVVPLALLLVTFLATLLPACRAAGVAPAETLRSQ